MTEPGTKDSDAMKLALLSVRARWWRSQGQESLAQRLEEEAATAQSDDAPTASQEAR